MKYSLLKRTQCCRNVPRLIENVTSKLRLNLQSILDKLSNVPDSSDDAEGLEGGGLAPAMYMAEGKDNWAKQWRNWPTTPHADNHGHFVSFVNEITDAIRRHTSDGPWQSSDTDFTFLHQGSFQVNSEANCDVPDFFLTRRRTANSKPENLSWSSIYCVGFISDSDIDDRFEDARSCLAEYARHCFVECQGRGYDRRFLLGLGVFRTKFALFVFDRSGVLSSEIFDVHSNPIQFLRAVVCLPLLDLEDLGKDTTCDFGDDGQTYITEGGKQYAVVKGLHVSKGLIGSGTYCFKVKDNEGNVRTLKDWWPRTEQAQREMGMLNLIKDVKNVTKLVHYEAVATHGPHGYLIPDGTKRLRVPISNARAEIHALDRGLYYFRRHVVWEDWMDDDFNLRPRDHMRCVMSTCGDPLYQFKSLPELVSAVLDVLETIDELDKRGIVHGDISSANIVLVASEGSPYRTGNLIDFETAIKRGSDYFTDTKRLTAMFLATGRVDDDGEYNALHALHDAESLIYVLIYLTLVFSGPGVSYKGFTAEGTIFGGIPDDLSDGSQFWDHCRTKKAIMCDARAFDKRVLQWMQPYFHPLRPCLVALREFISRASLRDGLSNWTRMDKAETEKEAKETRAKLKEMKGILRSTIVELEATERRATLPYALRPRPSKRHAPEEDGQAQAGPSKRKRRQSVAKRARK